MMKEKRLDWKQQWSLYKQSHFFVKLAVSILFIGLAFRLFSSQSISFSPVSESPFVDQTSATQADVLHQGPQKEKCDLFTGEWIPNPMGPMYTNESCHVVQPHQNCMKNGRPDSGYLYWRWKPRDCELPLFDPERFLDAMKNKSWGFIGDSISRNHVQSLLCILSKDVAPLPAAANPPPSTRSSFKFTRSFHKLLRSIFQRKSVKNTRVRIDDQCSENGFYVIYPSRGGALPKIPEAWEEGVDSVGVSPEYDSLVRRSVSERFTSSTAAAAVLGVSYG